MMFTLIYGFVVFGLICTGLLFYVGKSPTVGFGLLIAAFFMVVIAIIRVAYNSLFKSIHDRE